jgi:uncharacterized protein (DUF2236 family)
MKIVSSAQLEHNIDFVRAIAPDPAKGVFGPNSMMWQVDREALLFLGAGRALLMQLAHPWVATAIAEHSSTLSDPMGRFHRTFDIMFTLVFGSLDQALHASRRLQRRHAAVCGTIPETLGPYPEGSRYMANDVSALMWVHATLVDTALVAYELVLPPLGREACERYYAECRLLGALAGIPFEAQPSDWPAFGEYFSETVASRILTVSPAAKRIAMRVLAKAGHVPVPRWYCNLTASLMPERFRGAYELQHDQPKAARTVGVLRRLYPKLPARIRHVAPYQEAIGRMSGRTRPDLITRSLNRLWIGQPSLSEDRRP